MSGAEIRDLDYIAWKNNLSWTEPQEGARWKRAVNDENRRFAKALDKVKDKIVDFTKAMQQHASGPDHPFKWRGWEVHGLGFSPDQIWAYSGTDFECRAWDADVDTEGFFAAAVPVPGGFERFSVEVYSFEKGYRPVRISNLQQCGPQVAWLHGKSILIYLGSSQDLRYDSVHSWNAITKERKILYMLNEPTENLELGRAEDGSVYVKATDFVKTRLGFVLEDELVWTSVHQGSVFVHSFQLTITDTTRFPDLPDEPIESMSLKAGWVVTRRYGIRSLWRLTTKATLIATVWGEILFDSRDPTRLSIMDMRYEPYLIKTESWTISNPSAFGFPCSYYEDKAPVFVVHPDEHMKPKALLVTAYGAYGSPTRVGSLIQRWRPLLESGWVIASVCVPGSGDHDDAWKRAGQRLNRSESIRMLKETIQSLQEELNISPATTVMYGRSAGGLLVISTATQTVDLVGALYVESPYVDVLRTISNPDLPLTLLETKEFGIGSNPTNLIETGSWSPMEHTPKKGLPGLFVIARSDLADLEVFPYEVVKWIRRIRGSPAKGLEKLLHVDNGQGHFATSLQTRAEDLALLDNWIENPLIETSPDVRIKNDISKYRMPNNGMSMRNRNRKNRKNTMRKNRKNRRNNGGNAPAANATMMGGRRRKHRMGEEGFAAAMGMMGGRKHRRSTRRNRH